MICSNTPAKPMSAPADTLKSCGFFIVGNICAHHARLWNRELGIRPERPKQANFRWPDYLGEDRPLTRIAVVLAILHHLM